MAILSSLAVTKDLLNGLVHARQSIDSASSLEETHSKGVISDYLQIYDTHAPALRWWSDLAALEYANMNSRRGEKQYALMNPEEVQNEKINILQKN
jgi:hypothetical protein